MAKKIEIDRNPSSEKLQSLVDRIERLEAERSALNADIREIYTEARTAGFDTAVLRRVIRDRKKDGAVRAEQMDLFDTYWNRLAPKPAPTEAEEYDEAAE